MRIIFSLLTITLIIAGCQKKIDYQTNVALINETELQNLINENIGKILVINVWATWCIPCVEEMPDLVQLNDSYESEDVAIIGISIDYPEEIKSKIQPFIKKNKINFPNYVNNFNNDEALINFLNKDWNGAIPATFIYDKKGAQKEFLIGKQTYKNFFDAIEKVRIN